MRNIWKVIILNISFYVGIIFDQCIVDRYGYDYIIHVILYMILVFSSIVFEESIRKTEEGFKRIKIVSGIDFSIRILIMAYHLFCLITNNSKRYNYWIAISFILNLVLEFYMLKNTSKQLCEHVDKVTGKAINKFIKDILINKKNLGLSNEQLKKVNLVLDITKLHGQENIIAIIICVLIFVMSTLISYVSVMSVLFISVLVTAIIGVFLLLHIHCSVIKIMDDKNEGLDVKIVLENISVSLGICLLFVAELVVKNNFGILRISVWMLGFMFLIPMFNRRLIVREKIKSFIRKSSLDRKQLERSF